MGKRIFKNKQGDPSGYGHEDEVGIGWVLKSPCPVVASSNLAKVCVVYLQNPGRSK
jgi:hypothetical protein